jgi:hypothetical protein
MAIVNVGIDLAKNVFAVFGVDEAGKPAIARPAVARAKLRANDGLGVTSAVPASPEDHSQRQDLLHLSSISTNENS